MSGQTVLNTVQIVLFFVMIFLELLYSIPILLIRRFHTINNVFTVNLCMAALCCSMYWLFFFCALLFSPSIFLGQNYCDVISFFRTTCTIQVPLSVAVVSVHRLCSIVYHAKPFFGTKRWAAICIASQWITSVILALPAIIFADSVNITSSIRTRQCSACRLVLRTYGRICTH
jgi:hypothetical protein